jgi:hypothetical protein
MKAAIYRFFAEETPQPLMAKLQRHRFLMMRPPFCSSSGALKESLNK